ncbi:MAG: hypothetical protein ABFS39_00955 [Pseudomonadota bacterium]
MNEILPTERFLQTLEIVSREATHLAYSWEKLYSHKIDAYWVRQLEHNPELAERLEAFASRFGRMQDTIADKLLPRWLAALAETPGSQIETLNRAERLGVVEDVERWLKARKLRNCLVHEYMESAEQFANDLNLAKDYSLLLLDCFNHLLEYAARRMKIDMGKLPKALVFG